MRLHAEKIGARSGRRFGPFPQAFSDLALTHAVVHPIRSERGEDPARFAPVGQPEDRHA